MVLFERFVMFQDQRWKDNGNAYRFPGEEKRERRRLASIEIQENRDKGCGVMRKVCADRPMMVPLYFAP